MLVHSQETGKRDLGQTMEMKIPAMKVSSSLSPLDGDEDDRTLRI